MLLDTYFGLTYVAATYKETEEFVIRYWAAETPKLETSIQAYY
jgi:hypothetical protein